MLAGTKSTLQLCQAYALKMPAEHYFSHTTAAEILGLPVPESAVLHVTSAGPAREPRGRGLVGHRVKRGRISVVMVGGLPVSSPLDTWVCLAELLGIEDLIVVGDALVRRVNPIATMEQLRGAVAAASRRRGCRRLAQALEHVRPRTDSPRETTIRRWLVLAALPEPVVNFAILNARGQFVAFTDLGYPELRVAVEYDGGHHFTAEQALLDIDRVERLMALNWRVVRLNKTHSRATMVALVRAALLQAGWRP